eukprot:COSAG01_NODE_40608_length_461_cov_2.552486_1_plen_127_part_10
MLAWVLVEWILAIELHTANKVLTVLPILLGEQANGGMSELLKPDLLERLPEVAPAGEIKVVEDFLRDHGIAPSAELATRTVRRTVELLIREFLHVPAWELCGDGELDLHGDVGAQKAGGEIKMFEEC